MFIETIGGYISAHFCSRERLIKLAGNRQDKAAIKQI